MLRADYPSSTPVPSLELTAPTLDAWDHEMHDTYPECSGPSPTSFPASSSPTVTQAQGNDDARVRGKQGTFSLSGAYRQVPNFYQKEQQGNTPQKQQGWPQEQNKSAHQGHRLGSASVSGFHSIHREGSKNPSLVSFYDDLAYQTHQHEPIFHRHALSHTFAPPAEGDLVATPTVSVSLSNPKQQQNREQPQSQLGPSQSVAFQQNQIHHQILPMQYQQPQQQQQQMEYSPSQTAMEGTYYLNSRDNSYQGAQPIGPSHSVSVSASVPSSFHHQQQPEGREKQVAASANAEEGAVAMQVPLLAMGAPCGSSLIPMPLDSETNRTAQPSSGSSFSASSMASSASSLLFGASGCPGGWKAKMDGLNWSGSATSQGNSGSSMQACSEMGQGPTQIQRGLSSSLAALTTALSLSSSTATSNNHNNNSSTNPGGSASSRTLSHDHDQDAGLGLGSSTSSGGAASGRRGSWGTWLMSRLTGSPPRQGSELPSMLSQNPMHSVPPPAAYGYGYGNGYGNGYGGASLTQAGYDYQPHYLHSNNGYHANGNAKSVHNDQQLNCSYGSFQHIAPSTEWDHCQAQHGHHHGALGGRTDGCAAFPVHGIGNGVAQEKKWASHDDPGRTAAEGNAAVTPTTPHAGHGCDDAEKETENTFPLAAAAPPASAHGASAVHPHAASHARADAHGCAFQGPAPGASASAMALPDTLPPDPPASMATATSTAHAHLAPAATALAVFDAGLSPAALSAAPGPSSKMGAHVSGLVQWVVGKPHSASGNLPTQTFNNNNNNSSSSGSHLSNNLGNNNAPVSLTTGGAYDPSTKTLWNRVGVRPYTGIRNMMGGCMEV